MHDTTGVTPRAATEDANSATLACKSASLPGGDRATARRKHPHATGEITSDRIGRPSGHFAQAIAVEARGRLVFISGMTSKGADGSVVSVGDIEAQTRQMCENVKAAVEAAAARWRISAASMSMSADARLRHDP